MTQPFAPSDPVSLRARMLQAHCQSKALRASQSPDPLHARGWEALAIHPLALWHWSALMSEPQRELGLSLTSARELACLILPPACAFPALGPDGQGLTGDPDEPASAQQERALEIHRILCALRLSQSPATRWLSQRGASSLWAHAGLTLGSLASPWVGYQVMLLIPGLAQWGWGFRSMLLGAVILMSALLISAALHVPLRAVATLSRLLAFSPALREARRVGGKIPLGQQWLAVCLALTQWRLASSCRLESLAPLLDQAEEIDPRRGLRARAQLERLGLCASVPQALPIAQARARTTRL